jgi:hypothetical protein
MRVCCFVAWDCVRHTRPLFKFNLCLKLEVGTVPLLVVAVCWQVVQPFAWGTAATTCDACLYRK